MLLLLVLLALGPSTSSVFADDPLPGCFPVVLSVDVAMADHPGPIPIRDCPEPPETPCTRPDPPTIEPGSEKAMEVVLRSTATHENSNNFGDVVEVKWYANAYDPSTHSWESLWVEYSTDVELYRDGTTSDFLLAAPGLVKEGTHRFGVAYCYEFASNPSEKACECWSNTLQHGMTSAWTSAGPTPPAWATQYVEDNFDRPATREKYDPLDGSIPSEGKGDGLGPDPGGDDYVWLDSVAGYGPGNGTHIGGRQEDPLPASATPADQAIMPQAAVATWKEEVIHPHQYAEAKFGVWKSGGGGYNFDVHARSVGPAGYFVKLAYLFRDANDHPKIVVGSFSGSNVTEFESPEAEKFICDEPQECQCSGEVPLSAGSGETVWLRVEVDDLLEDPEGTRVLGTVAWDCPAECSSSCDITGCGSYCQVYHDDESVFGVGMKGKKGRVGIDAHEVEYHVDLFRAGSADPE